MRIDLLRGVRDWKRVDMSEADEALKESQKALREAHVKTGRARELGDSLRALRERNHFSEQIAAIFNAAAHHEELRK